METGYSQNEDAFLSQSFDHAASRAYQDLANLGGEEGALPEAPTTSKEDPEGAYELRKVKKKAGSLLTKEEVKVLNIYSPKKKSSASKSYGSRGAQSLHLSGPYAGKAQSIGSSLASAKKTMKQNQKNKFKLSRASINRSHQQQALGISSGLPEIGDRSATGHLNEKPESINIGSGMLKELAVQESSIQQSQPTHHVDESLVENLKMLNEGYSSVEQISKGEAPIVTPSDYVEANEIVATGGLPSNDVRMFDHGRTESGQIELSLPTENPTAPDQFNLLQEGQGTAQFGAIDELNTAQLQTPQLEGSREPSRQSRSSRHVNQPSNRSNIRVSFNPSEHDEESILDTEPCIPEFTESPRNPKIPNHAIPEMSQFAEESPSKPMARQQEILQTYLEKNKDLEAELTETPLYSKLEQEELEKEDRMLDAMILDLTAKNQQLKNLRLTTKSLMSQTKMRKQIHHSQDDHRYFSFHKDLSQQILTARQRELYFDGERQRHRNKLRRMRRSQGADDDISQATHTAGQTTEQLIQIQELKKSKLKNNIARNSLRLAKKRDVEAIGMFRREMQVSDLKSDKIYSIEHQLRKLRDKITAVEQEVEFQEAKLAKNEKHIDELERHDRTLQKIGKKYGVNLDTIKRINAFFDLSVRSNSPPRKDTASSKRSQSSLKRKGRAQLPESPKMRRARNSMSERPLYRSQKLESVVQSTRLPSIGRNLLSKDQNPIIETRRRKNGDLKEAVESPSKSKGSKARSRQPRDGSQLLKSPKASSSKKRDPSIESEAKSIIHNYLSTNLEIMKRSEVSKSKLLVHELQANHDKIKGLAKDLSAARLRKIGQEEDLLRQRQVLWTLQQVSLQRSTKATAESSLQEKIQKLIRGQNQFSPTSATLDRQGSREFVSMTPTASYNSTQTFVHPNSSTNDYQRKQRAAPPAVSSTQNQEFEHNILRQPSSQVLQTSRTNQTVGNGSSRKKLPPFGKPSGGGTGLTDYDPYQATNRAANVSGRLSSERRSGPMSNDKLSSKSTRKAISQMRGLAIAKMASGQTGSSRVLGHASSSKKFIAIDSLSSGALRLSSQQKQNGVDQLKQKYSLKNSKILQQRMGSKLSATTSERTEQRRFDRIVNKEIGDDSYETEGTLFETNQQKRLRRIEKLRDTKV